jgi:hypothetical protein
MSLIVYYEVPAAGNNRKEVKRKFENFAKPSLFTKKFSLNKLSI